MSADTHYYSSPDSDELVQSELGVLKAMVEKLEKFKETMEHNGTLVEAERQQLQQIQAYIAFLAEV